MRGRRHGTLLFVGILIVLVAAAASAKMYEPPKSVTTRDKIGTVIQRKVLQRVDTDRRLAEDRQRTKNSREPRPPAIAAGLSVAFDLTNSGTWQTLSDGRLWRLSLQSPGATHQSLGFTRFALPAEAKLWIYDPQRRHVEGPYTARNRARDGSFWTPIIEGDEITIELFVPNGVGQPAITIGKVNQGFTAFGRSGEKGGFAGAEGACNNDVVCPAGIPWADPIHAVAVYTYFDPADGLTHVCTGTLLNDTSVDFKPYFLTANHCQVNAPNEASVVAYWNDQSLVCGNHGPPVITDNQSGAIYRASYAPSDFRLLELAAVPDPGFHVYHAGWDATGVAPPSTVGIHHPRGDVKAITFSNTPPQPMVFYGSVADPSGNHWRAEWDSGVTEGGSSGSCLFDTTTQRCIGQLHGGPSGCGVAASDMHDYYGRLSVSWEGGGTPQTRLKDWLDTANTGILSMWGDPHNTTADGVHYNFQGAGEYVSYRGEGMEIQTRMTPVATTFDPGPDPYDGVATCVSLNSAVAARVGGHRVTIEPNLSGIPDPSGLQVRVDGSLTSVTTSGVPVGSGRIAKTADGDAYVIDFPNGAAVNVTPQFWSSQGKWYMNVDFARNPRPAVGGAGAGALRTGGLMAAIAPGSWLPALPDGSSVGSMPATVHQRYLTLYQKFGEAWRVDDKSTLFDYAPDTSTGTFTLRSWPQEKPPCVLPKSEPAKPLSANAAAQACGEIRDRKMQADCAFDVMVTGEKGFAKLYLASQRLRAGATAVMVTDAKNPTRSGEAAMFTVTVLPRMQSAGVPVGTIQFVVDGKPAGDAIKLDSYGRAAWRTENLKDGDHTVSAAFTPGQGSAFLAASSLDQVHTVRGSGAVTINDLPMQAGDENTACPASGVPYTRADAATVPYLRLVLPGLDQQCSFKGPGLTATNVTFLKCSKDPRGAGFGPNASANVTCSR